jgi:hypothetical protein
LLPSIVIENGSCSGRLLAVRNRRATSNDRNVDEAGIDATLRLICISVLTKTITIFFSIIVAVKHMLRAIFWIIIP